MDTRTDTMMRRVEPIDLPEKLAAAFGDGVLAPNGHVLIVDPITRRPIGTPVPAALADCVLGIFDQLAAAGEARAAEARGVASQLRDVVGEAEKVGQNMRTLMFLFDRALDDDVHDDDRQRAAELVSDCIRTMARRLDALGTKADAVHLPLFDGSGR